MLFPQFPLKRKTNGVFIFVHTVLLIIFPKERIPDQKQELGCLYLSNVWITWHISHLPLPPPTMTWLTQCGERALRPPALETTLSVLLQLSSLPLQLRGPHLLMTGTRNTQQHLLPNSSCLMFGWSIFAQKEQEFDILTFLFSASCVPPSMLCGLRQRPKEHGKTFNK